MIQLSTAAQQLIKRICATYATQPFEEGKEERFRPVHLCRAEHRLALRELREAGMLEVLQKMWGEKLYYIPAEKFPLLQIHYFPYEVPCSEDTKVIQTTMDGGPGLAGDLFQALLFVGQEGLPIITKGSIHKKNMSRLGTKLYLQAKHLHGLEMTYPNAELYPPHAVLIVDLMLSLGLLKRQDNAYTLEFEALESWLDLPESGMSDLLYSAVNNRYGSADPSNQHFRYLITRPEFALREWTSLSQVLDWMEASMLSVSALRIELEASSLAWLEFLTGCGWCQIGKDREGNIYFRWMKMKPHMEEISLPIGVSTGMFIVQSDFEVLVPPEVSYTVRWSLACCAELLTVDHMWTFRLTRDQLELANERGMPPHEVISWLDEYSLGGLPEQVKLVLDQWGDAVGRTSFSEIVLLTCRNEEEGDAIAEHPRLQSSLYRLGPVYFCVAKDSEEKVRRELTDAGLAPHRSVQGRNVSKPKPVPVFHRKKAERPVVYSLPSPRAEQGLIVNRAPLPYFQPAPNDSEGTLLPGEENTPSMWIKEWHCYHRTTAQKIMEQALLWGIKVRIMLADQIYEFIPEKVRGNPWRIMGYLMFGEEGRIEEIELEAGSWKEIQLIIPHR